MATDYGDPSVRARAFMYRACFACGTSTPIEHATVAVNWYCPTCREKEIDAIVAERAAPLVEFAEFIVRLTQREPDSTMYVRARDALARWGAGGGGA